MVDADSEQERLRAALDAAAPVLATRIAERIAALEARSSPDAQSIVSDIAHQVTQMVAVAMETDASPTTDDGRRHLVQFTTRVLRGGVPVDNVLRGIRIALEEGMSLTDTLADELGIGTAARNPFIRRLLAWSDLAMLTASETHHELIEPIPERLRRFGPLLGRLRSGQPTTDDLETLSRVGGETPYLTLVARLPLAEGTTTVRLVDELAGRGAIVAFVNDEVIALVVEEPHRVGDVVAGVGPRASAVELTGSFRLADRALHTAVSLGWRGIHHFDELGILPAVVDDQDVGRSLTKRYLDPCLTAAGGAELVATVTEYLARESNVARTATALTIHENTLRYRLARFEEVTGANLRDTRTRAEIWWAITRTR